MRDDHYARHVVNILKDTRKEYLKDAGAFPPQSMFQHVASAKVEAIEEILEKLDVHPWNEKRKRDRTETVEGYDKQQRKGYKS
ncbi:hypothetical protein CMO96_00235 [Candidatus Woesebacteria bacterium]|nr:hypothetical protein [Candidatus Woesebacteria bacterium]|tara:strand:- start:885 stop:1133 length:249 start_codon:yes stop_codon:yes gene_type:complete